MLRAVRTAPFQPCSALSTRCGPLCVRGVKILAASKPAPLAQPVSSTNSSADLVASTSSTQARSQPQLALAAAAALMAGGLALTNDASAAQVNLLAQTAEGLEAIQAAENILRPLLTVFTLLYIIRIPMTWYPEIDGKQFPWLLVYVPTEPALSVARRVVPLLNGVDISPIVLTGLLSFMNEILLGPQGLLTLLERQGGF